MTTAWNKTQTKNKKEQTAATSSSLLPTRVLTANSQNQQLCHIRNGTLPFTAPKRSAAFRVQAAKLPAGVVVPKVEPKFTAPFLGFTRTAEIWNSRACMIGTYWNFHCRIDIEQGNITVDWSGNWKRS